MQKFLRPKNFFPKSKYFLLFSYKLKAKMPGIILLQPPLKSILNKKTLIFAHFLPCFAQNGQDAEISPTQKFLAKKQTLLTLFIQAEDKNARFHFDSATFKINFNQKNVDFCTFFAMFRPKWIGCRNFCDPKMFCRKANTFYSV